MITTIFLLFGIPTLGLIGLIGYGQDKAEADKD